MLSFVPDSVLEMVVNVILVVGVISTFLTLFVINRILRWIPALAAIYPFLQLISVLILGAGIFFKGSYATEASWRDKVKEAQERAAQAEQEARNANEELAKVAAGKIKYIKGRTEYITEYIDREITKWDTKFLPGGVCEIPKEFIEAHNKGAARPEFKK